MNVVAPSLGRADSAPRHPRGTERRYDGPVGRCWAAGSSAIVIALLFGFYSVVDSAVDRAKARRAQQMAAASCAWKQPDARALCMSTTANVADAPAADAPAVPRTTTWRRQGVAVAGAAN